MVFGLNIASDFNSLHIFLRNNFHLFNHNEYSVIETLNYVEWAKYNNTANVLLLFDR